MKRGVVNDVIKPHDVVRGKTEILQVAPVRNAACNGPVKETTNQKRLYLFFPLDPQVIAGRTYRHEDPLAPVNLSPQSCCECRKSVVARHEYNLGIHRV